MTTRRDEQFPDHVLNWLKSNGIKLTRKAYLEIAFMGDPPKELSAEEEAALPRQIQKKSWRKGK